MDVRQAIHSEHAKTLDTDQLRKEFLVEEVFVADEVTITYSHIDRIIFGGIKPVHNEVILDPDLGKAIGVDFFLQRRELGLINIGGDGVVIVDGERFDVDSQQALYIGQGTKEVSFSIIMF